MSTIASTGSLSTGAQAAVRGIQSAEANFERASNQVQSQMAAASQAAQAGGSKSAQTSQSNVVAPPNPGPPGGANPADLTEAMAQPPGPPQGAPDLAEAMVQQDLSAHQISANVKTLQAFDEMLGEVLRLAPDRGSAETTKGGS